MLSMRLDLTSSCRMFQGIRASPGAGGFCATLVVQFLVLGYRWYRILRAFGGESEIGLGGPGCLYWAVF